MIFQDKSADVRKAADPCLTEILRVSGQETVYMLIGMMIPCIHVLLLRVAHLFFQVTKNLRDIQGPALAIVLERLRPHGALQGVVLEYCSPCVIYKYSSNLNMSYF